MGGIRPFGALAIIAGLSVLDAGSSMAFAQDNGRTAVK